MATDYDVLIIGGGLVGASLACSLSVTSLKVAVVEAVPFLTDVQPSYDDRTTALAYGSRRIFEGIGVWEDIEATGSCPILNIHISDRGHFGIARLCATDVGQEALGYVVQNRIIGAALIKKIQAADNIDLLCPAQVMGIRFTDTAAVLQIQTAEESTECSTRLAVVADGGRSRMRESLGIPLRRVDYQQSAIVTNVMPERPHNFTAYERFTETGPLALLPLHGGRCGVVWSTRPEQLGTILGWEEEEFLAQLHKRFGNRLGVFECMGKRQSYPLHLTRVQEHVRERLVLIGNAAHAVHPVAGQGFNLGLRDVATLAQVIADAAAGGKDIGALPVLQNYAHWRRRDNRRVSFFTDGLIRIFSNEFIPLIIARNLGLVAVDLLPGIKRGFTRRTSGLNGRLPRLARGLPLIMGMNPTE